MSSKDDNMIMINRGHIDSNTNSSSHSSGSGGGSMSKRDGESFVKQTPAGVNRYSNGGDYNMLQYEPNHHQHNYHQQQQQQQQDQQQQEQQQQRVPQPYSVSASSAAQSPSTATMLIKNISPSAQRITSAAVKEESSALSPIAASTIAAAAAFAGNDAPGNTPKTVTGRGKISSGSPSHFSSNTQSKSVSRDDDSSSMRSHSAASSQRRDSAGSIGSFAGSIGHSGNRSLSSTFPNLAPNTNFAQLLSEHVTKEAELISENDRLRNLLEEERLEHGSFERRARELTESKDRRIKDLEMQLQMAAASLGGKGTVLDQGILVKQLEQELRRVVELLEEERELSEQHRQRVVTEHQEQLLTMEEELTNSLQLLANINKEKINLEAAVERKKTEMDAQLHEYQELVRTERDRVLLMSQKLADATDTISQLSSTVSHLESQLSGVMQDRDQAVATVHDLQYHRSVLAERLRLVSDEQTNAFARYEERIDGNYQELRRSLNELKLVAIVSSKFYSDDGALQVGDGNNYGIRGENGSTKRSNIDTTNDGEDVDTQANLADFVKNENSRNVNLAKNGNSTSQHQAEPTFQSTPSSSGQYPVSILPSKRSSFGASGMHTNPSFSSPSPPTTSVYLASDAASNSKQNKSVTFGNTVITSVSPSSRPVPSATFSPSNVTSTKFMSSTPQSHNGNDVTSNLVRHGLKRDDNNFHFTGEVMYESHRKNSSIYGQSTVHSLAPAMLVSSSSSINGTPTHAKASAEADNKPISSYHMSPVSLGSSILSSASPSSTISSKISPPSRVGLGSSVLSASKHTSFNSTPASMSTSSAISALAKTSPKYSSQHGSIDAGSSDNGISLGAQTKTEANEKSGYHMKSTSPGSTSMELSANRRWTNLEFGQKKKNEVSNYEKELAELLSNQRDLQAAIQQQKQRDQQILQQKEAKHQSPQQQQVRSNTRQHQPAIIPNDAFIIGHEQKANQQSEDDFEPFDGNSTLQLQEPDIDHEGNENDGYNAAIIGMNERSGNMTRESVNAGFVLNLQHSNRSNHASEAQGVESDGFDSDQEEKEEEHEKQPGIHEYDGDEVQMENNFESGGNEDKEDNIDDDDDDGDDDDGDDDDDDDEGVVDQESNNNSEEEIDEEDSGSITSQSDSSSIMMTDSAALHERIRNLRALRRTILQEASKIASGEDSSHVGSSVENATVQLSQTNQRLTNHQSIPSGEISTPLPLGAVSMKFASSGAEASNSKQLKGQHPSTGQLKVSSAIIEEKEHKEASLTVKQNARDKISNNALSPVTPVPIKSDNQKKLVTSLPSKKLPNGTTTDQKKRNLSPAVSVSSVSSKVVRSISSNPAAASPIINGKKPGSLAKVNNTSASSPASTLSKSLINGASTKSL